MPVALIALFTTLNILNYMDRYMLVALMPAVQAEFGFTHQQAGTLAAAFVPGYVLFSPLFGYLGDRYKRPQLMALGVLLWSLATLGSALAGSFYGFVIARVLVGVGEASFVSIGPGYLKDRLQDPIKLNRALSWFFSAVPVGSALGFVLGGVLAQRLSWQSAFWVGGIPGLLLLPLVLRLAEVRGALSAIPGLFSSLGSLLANPLLWFSIGGYILNAFALNGIAAFLSAYGVSIGFSLEKIGFYFGVILLAAGFVGTWGGGQLASRLASAASDKIKVLFWFIGISSLLATPFLLAAFYTSQHWLFLLLCLLTELLVFAGTAPVNSIIILSCPAALVTFTQGLSILLINVLGTLPAPVVVGAIADSHGLGFGLRLLTIPLLLSGLVWTFGALHLKLKNSHKV